MASPPARDPLALLRLHFFRRFPDDTTPDWPTVEAWICTNVPAADRAAFRKWVEGRIGARPPGSAAARRREAHPLIERLDEFELYRRIDEGGMGVVYEAYDTLLDRTVAVKRPKPGLRLEVAARFEGEVRRTAGHPHPGIPPVYRHGRDAAGVPYMAMLYVEGETLAARLAAGEPFDRHLDTLVKVCQAVGSRHPLGMIHRDMKPANIIVGRSGEVFVLDWGLSREWAGADGAAPPPAASSSGTRAYMAPEQFTGQATPQTDVFQLGGILCQLLTGHPPGLLHGETPTPADRAEALAGAQRRLEGLRPVYRELADIAIRCLSPTPDDRFADASHLGTAITDYRTAAAEREREQYASDAKRSLRRWAFATVLLLAVVASVGWYQAADEGRAKETALGNERSARGIAETESQAKGEALATAERRLIDLRRVYHLFGSALGEMDPRAPRSEGIPLQVALGDRLDRAAAELDRLTVEDPLILAEFRTAVGSVQLGLGRPRQAIPQFRLAITARTDALGPDHPDTLLAMNGLAAAHSAAGETGPAVELGRQVYERRRDHPDLGPDHPDTLTSLNNLGVDHMLAGRPDRAVKELAEAQRLRAARPDLGPDHSDTLSSQNNLAAAHIHIGRPDLAINDLEKLSPRLKAHPQFGEEHYLTVTTAHNLGHACLVANRWSDAVRILRPTFDQRVRTLGPNHPATLKTASLLGAALLTTKQAAEANDLLRKTHDAQTRALGPDHPDTLVTDWYQAVGLFEVGNMPAAVDAFRKHRERLVAHPGFGADHPQTLKATGYLGLTHHRNGQTPKAVETLEQALRGLTAHPAVGPNHPDTFWCANALGAAYGSAKRYDQAINSLERAADGRSAHPALGPDHPTTINTKVNLAVAYGSVRRWDKAVPILEDALRRSRNHPELGDRHPDTLRTLWNLGYAYQSAGHTDDARRTFGEYSDAVRNAYRGQPLQHAAWLEQAATVLLRDGWAATAEPLLREALAVRLATAPEGGTTYATKCLLGRSLLLQKLFAEAEEPLLGGYAGLRKQPGPVPAARTLLLATTADDLIRFYAATRQPQKVATWRAERDKLPPEQLPPPRPTGG